MTEFLTNLWIWGIIFINFLATTREGFVIIAAVIVVGCVSINYKHRNLLIKE
jgi:hypothetical protein